MNNPPNFSFDGVGFGAKETCSVVLNIHVNNLKIPVILPNCSICSSILKPLLKEVSSLRVEWLCGGILRSIVFAIYVSQFHLKLLLAVSYCSMCCQ